MTNESNPNPFNERFYAQLHAACALSVDYDEDSGETRRFFDLIRIKLHHAVAGKAPAELLSDSHLSDEEAAALQGLVEKFLEFADGQARRRRQLFMRDWPAKLDAFLRLEVKSQGSV